MAEDRVNPMWIHRVPDDAVDRALAEAPTGVLAGLRLAVKDNIDVAGMPTTAACPSFSREPSQSAMAVELLTAAGAVVVGKTNLDQFATGLVGTRSPYGATWCPAAPELVSGGSSSGSAVAVAAGEADLALGTDTAGSGRVPAAFCGIVGLKPTRGWVSTSGVVPACPSFDCTTIFARSIGLAAEAVRQMIGYDPDDISSRRRVDRAFQPARRFGVPLPEQLTSLDETQRIGFDAAMARARSLGFDVVEVDLTSYFDAGALLYGGGFVAERHASVGSFVDSGATGLDPVVAHIIGSAGEVPASRLAADTVRLAALSRAAGEIWQRVDAVLMPTVPFHPSLAEVEADPLGVNARLGTFVSGCNLVDWCAAVVPIEVEALDRPVGVQVCGPAWTDEVVWQAAARLAGEAYEPSVNEGAAIAVAVVGAHLSGQPLNHQLTDRDAVLLTTTMTAPMYRMVLLEGAIAKPGLLRQNEGGVSVEVEIWSMSPQAFGEFVDLIPPPLGMGSVVLMDGSSVHGFICEGFAEIGATDISRFGGWRAWLAGR